MNGALGIFTAAIIGLLGIGVAVGADQQHSGVGVAVGIAMALWAAYRVVNVIWWTKQDIDQHRGR